MTLGTCDSCPKENVTLRMVAKNFHLCDECFAAHDAANKEIEATADERVQAQRNVDNVYLNHVRQENAALRISSDIFNAKIKAISDLKKQIDEDPTIENKHYVLAQVLGERFAKLNDILFGLRKEVAEGENEQRAIQTFYNDLSKNLRESEREKIKLADLTYKPEVRVEKVVKEKPKLNWDKTGIKVESMRTGIPEQLIQMICLQHNLHPAAAVLKLNESGVKGSKQ